VWLSCRRQGDGAAQGGREDENNRAACSSWSALAAISKRVQGSGCGSAAASDRHFRPIPPLTLYESDAPPAEPTTRKLSGGASGPIHHGLGSSCS
jgi:hypothetical protein